MFFVLSKVLSFLLSPFTWLGILLLLALLTRKATFSRRYLLIAVVLFFVSGNRFLADELMRAWELPLTPVSQVKEHYDVGILLGGGIIQEDSKLQRLIFRNNNDRLLQALYLYKSGRIGSILISGGSGELFNRNMKEGSLVRKYLLQIGIPDSVLLVDSVSDNTHENAVMCSSLLSRYRPGGHYLLITSASHMRRAVACFEKQKIRVDMYATDKKTGPRRWDIYHLLVPDIKAILTYQSLLHETIGYLTYKVAGYL